MNTLPLKWKEKSSFWKSAPANHLKWGLKNEGRKIVAKRAPRLSSILLEAYCLTRSKKTFFIFRAALGPLLFLVSKPRAPSISQVMTSSSVYFPRRAKFLSSLLHSRAKCTKRDDPGAARGTGILLASPVPGSSPAAE